MNTETNNYIRPTFIPLTTHSNKLDDSSKYKIINSKNSLELHRKNYFNRKSENLEREQYVVKRKIVNIPSSLTSSNVSKLSCGGTLKDRMLLIMNDFQLNQNFGI